jgi:ferritin-like metal-binding protein YciE
MQKREIEMAATKTLDDLFLDTLKDIYFAEKQILKALPKMARAAKSEEGKAGFLQHRDETQGQIERLEQVFELLGKAARGKTCEAIQGIIAEGEEIIEEFKESPALDAGLISSAQAVEHYEIARYGTLIEWANQLGLKDAVPLLEANLAEEKATDEKLTLLAKASANAKGKSKAA